jgi:outer membrane biosynthesis protein TonB
MGQEEYHLKSLADDQLLAGLASIVRRRNQITAEFLAYLAELDERQLFLDLGFPSLFEYCLVTLGLCESTAGRHIAAARVCRNHPQVFSMVASGALHASALSLLRKHLTPENAGELFELCTHRSARKVEELLAARFARPDVRDLVRRLPRFAIPEAVPPAQAGFTLNVGCSAEQSPTEAPSREPTEAPSREPPAVLEKAPIEALSREPPAATKPEDAPKPRRLEPLSTDRYGVHFTADGEFRELLERVRGLAGHRLPSGDLMTLIKRGLEAYERELEKERFAVGRKSRRRRGVASASASASAVLSAPDVAKPDVAKPDVPKPDPPKPDPPKPDPPKPDFQAKPSPKRNRRYPAAVTRAVFLRDGKQCTYVSPDGRRCGARRCLELDHIEPWAVGGESTIENSRLRCRAHNQRHARQYFGVVRVERAIQLSRQRLAAAQLGKD